MATIRSIQDNLKEKEFEGYMWWSDEPAPRIYPGDKPIEWPKEGANPFVIEGNLWNKVDERSYLIRFIDGKYLVYEFNLKGINPENITKLDYLPNRMPSDIKELKFKKVWTAQHDPLCNGFEVLKPAFIAFVGFKK